MRLAGKLLGFKEVARRNPGTTAKNSLGLGRAPGPRSEFVRGSSTNFPFWPGGLDSGGEDDDRMLEAAVKDGDGSYPLEKEEPLLTCPPGFVRGLDFPDPISKVESSDTDDERGRGSSSLNFAELLASGESKEAHQTEPEFEPCHGNSTSCRHSSI